MSSDDAVAAVARQRVILFSGHMIDAPDRDTPRFPPRLESAVAEAIGEKLRELDASSRDVGISSAACGSDILFAEAVLSRGGGLRIYLPFDEATFLDESVRFADSDWPQRYRHVVSHAEVFIAPTELGPLPAGVNAFERTNLWMLDEARRIGGENVAFIAVWDGEAGDGPGGTKHMMEAVSEAGGAVRRIDIRRLDDG